jgi:signal transduction histidine kinase
VVLTDVNAHDIETAKPLLDDHQHQLTVSLPNEPVVLEADQTRLAQAVTNLLNNAAKYTEDGGRIWLTAQHEVNNVVLTVQDTGVGSQLTCCRGYLTCLLRANSLLPVLKEDWV